MDSEIFSVNCKMFQSFRHGNWCGVPAVVVVV